MVDITTGPGVSHCATYNAPMRPCRRPNDYVIDYTTVEGEHIYVRVPANEEYRLNALKLYKKILSRPDKGKYEEFLRYTIPRLETKSKTYCRFYLNIYD